MKIIAKLEQLELRRSFPPAALYPLKRAVLHFTREFAIKTAKN